MAALAAAQEGIAAAIDGLDMAVEAMENLREPEQSTSSLPAMSVRDAGAYLHQKLGWSRSRVQDLRFRGKHPACFHQPEGGKTVWVDVEALVLAETGKPMPRIEVAA